MVKQTYGSGKNVLETMPLRVSTIDRMINTGGVERGSTILLSGGCGSGKTIFAMQSAYNAALSGEKTLYLTLEESPGKIRAHMKRSFGWDVESMEEKGLMSLQKVNSLDFLPALQDSLGEAKISKYLFKNHIKMDSNKLFIFDKMIELSFKPDRVVVDSSSALSAMFSRSEDYRLIMKILVDALNENNSLNLLINETEQEPMLYSKVGIEEFLVDGVIGLYNIRKGQLRRRALEIVKLRASDHVKEMVPYTITKEGIKILAGEKIY